MLTTSNRKCSNCKQPGHTVRTCQEKLRSFSDVIMKEASITESIKANQSTEKKLETRDKRNESETESENESEILSESDSDSEVYFDDEDEGCLICEGFDHSESLCKKVKKLLETMKDISCTRCNKMGHVKLLCPKK